ncbi:GGDEF domain-containing protein [Thiotrichales bacterium 19S3-7]|nr:GGDEF domain-containing protein [Thiotrichales bacterium 19S3-7]MCF6802134.1 GGDEF domain-containing protein [Thiotrichales bacterium 19S3-11]
MKYQSSPLCLERYIFAIIITVIGMVVMLGWSLKLINLIQIHPTFVPMQFNTALCFSLVGISILLISNKLRYLSSLIAIFALIIGTMTLIEYIFHTNLYIDELFIKHYILTETSHPGRMAPNTALCFLLSACVVILVNHFNYQWAKIVCISLLIVIGLLGFLSVMGYLLNIRSMYNWGNLTGMAIHTGFGFFLIALALFRLLLYPALSHRLSLTILLPACIGGIGLTFILISWQLFEMSQDNQIKRKLYNQLDYIQVNTNLLLDEKIKQTENLFIRLGWLHNDNFNLYKNELNQYINMNPSLILISQNTQLKNQKIYLNFHQKLQQPKTYIQNCINNIDIASSPYIINAVITDKTLCIYQKKHNYLAIYQLKPILDNIMHQSVFKTFGISFSKNNTLYYKKNIPEQHFFTHQWQISTSIKLLNTMLIAKLWPSELYIEMQHDTFLILYFIFGILITIFLVIITRGLQLIHQKNLNLNQQQHQLELIAYNDFLTGIPNRLKFRELALQSIFRAQRHQTTLALLFLDLDGFKPVNDIYGHDMGDIILKEVALRFAKTIRTNDTAARIGGDEFAIVLEDANFDGARIVAEKLIELAEQPFKTNQDDICLSVSIGIAIYPVDGTELDQLFKYADIQLYKAKSATKGKYYPKDKT